MMDPRYTLDYQLWLPRPIEQVFDFFADASNLQQLTPSSLHFQIVTPTPIEMRPGARIDYRLRIRGVPMGWQSEITVWEPPRRFVDEQRRGPYRQWIHEHLFEEQNGGTLVRDLVRYDVRCGWLVNRLFVRRELESVFAFRHKRMESLLGGDS
jgi:ligand-binding SRPBCC domain-containing protein